jgi:hypothetical protein
MRLSDVCHHDTFPVHLVLINLRASDVCHTHVTFQRSNIVLNGNFYNNTSVRKGPVYSQISQFNGNLTIKGVSVFAGNKVLNWTEYDPENKTTILWIGRNMNVRLGEAQWNATYAPNRTDFVLIVCDKLDRFPALSR